MEPFGRLEWSRPNIGSFVNIDFSPKSANLVPVTVSEPPRTRGYRKKERTRRQLLAAGLRVLAEKGQGLTVSDVVAEAEVSNGTFYNYFEDREALLEALAEQSALALASAVAEKRIEDPALRFASATLRVLVHAREDETWTRVLLRLISRPGSGIDFTQYLREDLAEGLAKGRFDVGPEDAALDQVAGLIAMTMRRLVEGTAAADAPERAVHRGLRAVGIDEAEAARLTREAAVSLRNERDP